MKTAAWVIRLLALVPAGSLAVLSGGAIYEAAQEHWWEVIAIFPWWGLGFSLAGAIVWFVWREVDPNDPGL